MKITRLTSEDVSSRFIVAASCCSCCCSCCCSWNGTDAANGTEADKTAAGGGSGSGSGG